MSKPIFYQGQEVGCLMFGEGVISSVRDETLRVHFAEDRHCFFLNGAWMKDARPTLYPIDQYREIIANLPAPQPEAWKPKPGEWCWFWEDNFDKCAVVGQFAGISDGEYNTIFGGYKWGYKHCAPFTGELPDHLKEVHP